MSKHKYSTIALMAMIGIFIVGGVIALDSEDVDEVCNTNSSLLKKNDGTWNCSTTNYVNMYIANHDHPLTTQYEIVKVNATTTTSGTGITETDATLTITKRS